MSDNLIQLPVKADSFVCDSRVVKGPFQNAIHETYKRDDGRLLTTTPDDDTPTFVIWGETDGCLIQEHYMFHDGSQKIHFYRHGEFDREMTLP